MAPSVEHNTRKKKAQERVAMFWTGKKTTREDEKEKQVKNLTRAFPSIRRPNNDDQLFEVRFVVEGQYSSLRILLAGDFPDIAPVIQAQGPVNHPWLDSQKVVVGSHKLKNWNSKSVLSEVVEECVQALMAGTNAPLNRGPVDSYGRPMSTPAPSTLTSGTTSSPQGVPLGQAQSIPYGTVAPASTAVPSATPLMATAVPVYRNQYTPAPMPAAAMQPSLPTTALAPGPAPVPSPAPTPTPVLSYQYTPQAAVSSMHQQYYPGAAAPTPVAPAAAPQPVPSQYSYSAYAYPAISPTSSAVPQPTAALPLSSAMPVAAVSPFSYPTLPAVVAAVPTPAAVQRTSLSPQSAGVLNYGLATTPAVASGAMVSPHAATIPPSVSSSSLSSADREVMSSSYSSSKKHEPEPISPIPIPDIPTRFTVFDGMTAIQLQRFLDDDVALTALAKNVDSIKTVTSLRDQLREANLERAQKNVEKSESIMALHRQAIETQAKLSSANRKYESVLAEVNKEFSFNAQKALSELIARENDHDAKSEDLGQKLVQGEIDTTAFLKEFMDVRTKYHSLHDRVALASHPVVR